MPKAPTAVALLKKVKLGTSWTFVPVKFTKNGKVATDSRQGAFYLVWREDKKRRYKQVGIDPTDAVSAKDRLAHELRGRAIGIKTPVEPGVASERTLEAAVDEYIAEKRAQGRKKKTLTAYADSLAKFKESCSKRRVCDIERKDLLSFTLYCRDELGLDPRTAHNHFSNVVSFLKANGLRGIAQKGDWPKYVEEEPEIYEREELATFFAACTPDQRLAFEFFLKTGMREQEVVFAEKTNLNLERGEVSVRYKPEYGFTPKNYCERQIPIPNSLAQELKRWIAKSDKLCPLLFPTKGCKPKLDFLDTCKAIAYRAGLNCGHCDRKREWKDKNGKAHSKHFRCAEGPHCEHWFLHKFRATFATRHLWAGVDLRTVQLWMGHNDMESTMRYLKPNRSQQVKDRVEVTWA